MADRVLIGAARSWARVPVLVRIAAVYVAARLVTTGLLALAAAGSTALSRFGADAGIGDFVLGWDAQWYWLVAVDGYPADLPTTASGEVGENAWAFMPVFAYVAKIIGFAVGSWGGGALIVSLAAGFGACVALHRLLRDRIGAGAAMWAVAFLAFGPLAALFQVGYAESLFLMLLLFALDAVSRRRYALVHPLVLVAAFTRPGILAFALYLGLHLVLRLRRRRAEPLRVGEAVHVIVAGALATACGFAWPLIADAVTGRPGAYLATELAWRRNWGIGDGRFLPFEGWVQAARFWFGQWHLPAWLGVVALVLLIVAFAGALLAAPPVRRLGAEVRLWSASYALYLLAVFFPQSSVFRLLLPLAPLAGALAVPRSRGYRFTVLGLCVLGQWFWIWNMYALARTYWQVP